MATRPFIKMKNDALEGVRWENGSKTKSRNDLIKRISFLGMLSSEMEIAIYENCGGSKDEIIDEMEEEYQNLFAETVQMYS